MSRGPEPNTPHQQIKTKNCRFPAKNRFAPADPCRGVSVLSLAHSGGWTCECEHRGAGMCPTWRQVHLTRPASCTPARDLQHSSQSLSKCAGATSTTISPPNRACSTRDRFPRAYMHVFHRFLFHKIAEQRSRARTHMPLASLIAARCASAFRNCSCRTRPDQCTL